MTALQEAIRSFAICEYEELALHSCSLLPRRQRLTAFCGYLAESVRTI